METAAAPDRGEDLGDGLVRRVGRPGDEDAIVEHTVAAFASTTAQRIRARLAEPDGVQRWQVVWRGDRLVSCSALLAHHLWVDGVVVPAAQLEWVVTDPGFQRRGLVRAQVAAHRAAADAAGVLVSLVDGIPYLYRHLGWGYGLDWPPVHLVAVDRSGAPASDATTWHDGVAVRPATPADVDALAALDRHRPTGDVHMVRDSARWRWWVAAAASGDDEQLLVAEDGHGIAGWARIELDGEGDLVLLRPGVARTDQAVAALVARARRSVPPGWVLEVAGGTDRWASHLVAVGQPLPYDHGVYARVDDPAAMVRALTAALDRRLTAADRHDTGPLDLSLYEQTVRLQLEAGRVVGVARGPRIEDPFHHGDAGIAPDWFPALVLGRWGAAELARRCDDVTLGRHAELLEVLFPRLTSDVVSDL